MNRRKFIIFGIGPALVLQFLGAYIYFVWFADSETAKFIYGLTKLIMLLWPLGWLLIGAPIKVSALEWPSPQSIIKGALTGLLGAMIIWGAYQVSPHALGLAKSAIESRIATLGFAENFISFAITFSLFHSLFEEYYWRWFVNHGLRLRFSPVVASIIGSLGFASHHLIILSVFFSPAITLLLGTAVFAAGLIWSLMAKNTQGLWQTWLSHALIDGAIFAVIAQLILA